MAERNIYLKIEQIENYSPVEPDNKAPPPIQYRRDCMRGEGHPDGSIPESEVKARSLIALTYREYQDSGYILPKVNKIIRNDINEPVYDHRVPGTVIYAHPGEILKIHVWNCDNTPHAFHVHGLDYGIDSDGAYPFGVHSEDGRRSDEICPNDTWVYTFSVADDSIGAWPFHDHWRKVSISVNRGLFGGIVVLPKGISPPGSFVLPSTLAALPKEALKKANRKMAAISALPKGIRQLIDNQLDFLKEWIESVFFSENNLAQDENAILELGRHLEEEKHGCFSRIDEKGVQEVEDGLIKITDNEKIKSSSVSEALVNNEALSFTHLIPLFGTIHAPLFFHVMANPDADPIFDSGDLEELVGVFEFTFDVAGDYDYFCQFHPIMTGTVHVIAGGPANVNVSIVDGPPMDFSPKEITVGVGGTVRWENHSIQHHTVTSVNGGAIQSHCLNGRAFTGNTPTILGFSGQRIRWYVFNLDFGHEFHNFHTHAMRWKFAGVENQDTRVISPAESFVVETRVPQVVLLTGKLKKLQAKWPKPKGARLYLVKGDYIFHCHVHQHMNNGMIGMVRARQFLWLTEEMADQFKETTNLIPYNGTNACPDVDLQRCLKAGEGEWVEISGAPEVTMMHSMPLPNTTKMLYWGYTNEDQSRIFDWSTDTYSQPANQPADLPGLNLNSSNLWSGEHTFFDDASGTLIAHGGLTAGQMKSFLFDPSTETWSVTDDTTGARFYSTTLTLANGRALTLYGSASKSIEVYDPVAGTWGMPIAMPALMNHHVYYPWTFLQPDGKLFIAGPHGPSNRFDWNNAAATLESFPTINDNRSTSGEKGTAVMLILRPPAYNPEVIILGGNTPTTEQTSEIIDLSQAVPAWQSLPDLNEPRPFQVNSVVLPDGRVFVAGGIDNGVDGGPSEVYDPSNTGVGWELGPTMQHTRGYHSSMVMMPDGSVIFGGDPQDGGVPTNHERFYPGYFDVPRPIITSVPGEINYGAAFTVDTPDAGNINEVVLMSAGAVTHGFNMTQRGVECVINGAGVATVDVVAPPNGNIAPPGWWILFILDGNRTPSEGRWIRLTP